MKSENQMTFGGRHEGRFEREPARRVFAAELRESRHQFKAVSYTHLTLPTNREV